MDIVALKNSVSSVVHRLLVFKWLAFFSSSRKERAKDPLIRQFHPNHRHCSFSRKNSFPPFCLNKGLCMKQYNLLFLWLRIVAKYRKLVSHSQRSVTCDSVKGWLTAWFSYRFSYFCLIKLILTYSPLERLRYAHLDYHFPIGHDDFRVNHPPNFQ